MDQNFLYSAPIFMAAFFVIGFVVLMLIFFGERESVYKAAIAAAAIPPLGLWSVAFSKLVLPWQDGHSPAMPAFVMTFLIFPYSPVLLVICIAAFARHYRSKERLYRVEALLAVLTFAAGTVWTAYFLAWSESPGGPG